MKPRLHNANLNLLLPAWRSWLVTIMLGLAFLGLGGRALYLQKITTGFLQEQGEQRYSRVLTMEANRGMIVDRHGEPLAISTPVEAVYASPADVIDVLETPFRQKGVPVPAELSQKPLWTGEQIKSLADTLGLKVDEVARKLADRKKNFVYLKRQVTPDVWERVQELNLPGIYKRQEYRRYYPSSDVMAQLVGYVGVDGQGQEGVELEDEKLLAGKLGSRHVIQDRRGHIIEDMVGMQKPQDGQTIQLSIDRKVQYLAYRELKAAVDKYKAKAGGIVVLDARTGEVLALANLPSYNPNNRLTIDSENRRSRALTDVYEPGSTMKPFSVSSVLDAGNATPDTLVNTEGGHMNIGPNTIHDAEPHGVLSVSQVIQVSSNIGAAKLALTLEPETFWGYLNSCGFGTSTHSGFPGEVNGRLRPWKNWVPIDQATMAFGHGLSVTLLQMARAYTIFTNQGNLLPISFQKQVAPPVGKRVFSAKVADEMRLMLEKVTEAGGTAVRAEVLGYRVGGKTGTAEKLEGGVYVHKYVGSFVGFAPLSDPKVIVAVMIDEPSGQHFGGMVAAPVFSNVMAGTLRMLGVPPDAPAETIVAPTPADDKAAEVF